MTLTIHHHFSEILHLVKATMIRFYSKMKEDISLPGK